MKHVIICTFPWRHSIKWPMVIREGMAWGLMMTSGEIPSHVNGMSWEEGGTWTIKSSYLDQTKDQTHFLFVSDPARSLLAMATGKLVSNLRNSHRAYLDLTKLVPILVHRQHHLGKPAMHRRNTTSWCLPNPIILQGGLYLPDHSCFSDITSQWWQRVVFYW